MEGREVEMKREAETDLHFSLQNGLGDGYGDDIQQPPRKDPPAGAGEFRGGSVARFHLPAKPASHGREHPRHGNDQHRADDAQYDPAGCLETSAKEFQSDDAGNGFHQPSACRANRRSFRKHSRAMRAAHLTRMLARFRQAGLSLAVARLGAVLAEVVLDRKSTRLNSSHVALS